MPDGNRARARHPTPVAAGARVGALFSDHGRVVYGLCRMLLRDPTEADDATQETFVSAYRALLHGVDAREPAAWLAAIARNECRARLRARGREPLLGVEVDLAGGDEAHVLLERRLWLEELARALGELPPRQREAVVLRDLYGLRTREVGAALGLSRPAVESLVFRARRRLRVRLRPVHGALVLPVALREGLAQALPGFAGGAAAASGATGAVGASVLVTKLAAGTAAVGAATSVALVDAEQIGPPQRSPAAPAAAAPAGPVRAAIVVRAPAGRVVTTAVTGRRPDSRRRSGDDGSSGGSKGSRDRGARGEPDRGSSAPRADDGAASDGPGSADPPAPTPQQGQSSGPGGGDGLRGSSSGQGDGTSYGEPGPPVTIEVGSTTSADAVLPPDGESSGHGPDSSGHGGGEPNED